MIDFLLLLVLGAVTWCVASEGAWGAGITLLCVLFSGLLAMNYFEPLANLLENNVLAGSDNWRYRWDMISLVGLFALFVFLLRLATDRMFPAYVQVPPMVHEATRWSCAFLTGWITMAFLLTALHTAPLPREFIGFKPEDRNFFKFAAPDRQWLGFTQYVTEHIFPRYQTVPDPESGQIVRVPRIFDGPRFTVGEYQDQVWPSFPIRYATRRELFAAGPAVETPQPAARPTQRTRTGPDF